MMAMEPLKFLSEATLSELRGKISDHRSRYESGDFLDLEHENGWAIETAGVTVDYDLLATLDGSSRSAASDIECSLIIHQALQGMTPALAREERIWARLCHIECLEYSRERWLSGNTGDQLNNLVNLHMFAPNLTATRDDNAISRLWWNMHIASIADPADPEGALRLILKTTDIRSNFVERSRTVARKPLARAIVRTMRRHPWIISNDNSFRKFMTVLNRDGGGVLFEALTDTESDQLMDSCTKRAKAHLG